MILPLVTPLCVLLLFSGAIVNAQCTGSQAPGQAEFTLLTDPDGSAGVSTSGPNACSWTIVWPTNSNRSCIVLTIIRPERERSLTTVIDRRGSTLLSTDDGGVGVYRLDPALAPITVSVAAWSQVYTGVELMFSIVDSNPNVHTVYHRLELNDTSQTQFNIGVHDFPIGNGVPLNQSTLSNQSTPLNHSAAPVLNQSVTVAYNISCPRDMTLVYALWDRRALDVIRDNHYRVQRQVGFGFVSDLRDVRQYESVSYTDSQMWLTLLFSGRYDERGNLSLSLYCSRNQFVACTSRQPNGAIVRPGIIDVTAPRFVEGKQLRFASTEIGPRFDQAWPTFECALRVTCANASEDVVISGLKLSTHGQMSLIMTNPDGTLRSRFDDLSRSIITGSRWRDYTTSPVRDMTFHSPSFGWRTSSRWWPNMTWAAITDQRTSSNTLFLTRSVMVNITRRLNRGSFDPYNSNFMGLDAAIDCRPREPVEDFKPLDLCALRAAEENSVDPSNVTPNQWASTQPLGQGGSVRLAALNDEELSLHISGVASGVARAIHPIRLPITCGFYSNIIISVDDIQDFSIDDDPYGSAFLLYGNASNLRITGNSRRGLTDSVPWGYYPAWIADTPRTEILVDSPAEVQWTTTRPALGEAVPNLLVSAECTPHGRNGPPADVDWTQGEVRVTAVALPSSYLKYVKEPQGRIDGISSDADGGRARYRTAGNWRGDIVCHRRFKGCTIVIQSIFADLDPRFQSLVIIDSTGAVLMNVSSDASWILYAADFVDVPLVQAIDRVTVILHNRPGTNPITPGVTVTYFMDSTNSVLFTTPTVSRTKRLSPSSSHRLTVTRFVSVTVTRIPSSSTTGTITPPPTRTRAISQTGQTETFTRVATRSPTWLAPPPIVVALSQGGQAAVTATVAAAAAGTALGGASAPPEAARELQSLALIGSMQCRDSQNEALMSVQAVAGPATTSALPFTVDSTLEEGYLLGSLIIAVGLFVLHSIVMLFFRWNLGSTRAAWSASRFPNATLSLVSLLHSGLAIESTRILLRAFSAPTASAPTWHAIFVASLAFLAALALPLSSFVVYAKLFARFKIRFRVYSPDGLQRVISNGKERKGRLKELNAALDSATQQLEEVEDAAVSKQFWASLEASSAPTSNPYDLATSFVSATSSSQAALPERPVEALALREQIDTVRGQLTAVKKARHLNSTVVLLPRILRPSGYWIPRHTRNAFGFFYASFDDDLPKLWFLVPFARSYLLCVCIFAEFIPCTARLAIAAAWPIIVALATLLFRPFVSTFRLVIAVPVQLVGGSLLIVAAVPGISPDTRVSVLQSLVLVNSSFGILATVLGFVSGHLEGQLRNAYDRANPPAYKIDQLRRRQKRLGRDALSGSFVALEVPAPGTDKTDEGASPSNPLLAHPAQTSAEERALQ